MGLQVGLGMARVWDLDLGLQVWLDGTEGRHGGLNEESMLAGNSNNNTVKLWQLPWVER